MKCGWCSRAMDIVGNWVRPGYEKSGHIYKCGSCDTEVLVSVQASREDREYADPVPDQGRVIGGCLSDPLAEGDVVYRLRKRAEIRRQIHSRKSVAENKPDRISDLLEEAADEIIRLSGPR